MYLGPRRTAVEKIDHEIEVAEANLNLGIDNADWPLAQLAVSALKRLRAARERALTCHYHEIGVDISVS